MYSFFNSIICSITHSFISSVSNLSYSFAVDLEPISGTLDMRWDYRMHLKWDASYHRVSLKWLSLTVAYVQQAKDHILFILRALKGVMRIYRRKYKKMDCDQIKLQVFLLDVNRQILELEQCVSAWCLFMTGWWFEKASQNYFLTFICIFFPNQGNICSCKWST